MDAEDIVLGIIDALDRQVSGRTYLQKMAYFVSRLLPAQIGFEPHYYGPYSRLVSAEVDRAVSRGILSEDREEIGSSLSRKQFESVRYTYRLTLRGRKYTEFLKSINPTGFQKVAETSRKIQETNANYLQLSCAAKVDYLLRISGGRITRARAKEQAKNLGWRLSDSDIETAVGILEKLDLVKTG